MCRACGRPHVRRSHRTDAVERLLGLFFYYPFRCQVRGTRFRALQWGHRYVQRPIERRDEERLPVRIQVTILGPGGEVDAIASNLSLNGCALETAPASPPARSFALLLHVGETPIRVDSAVVRFSAGRVTGVEFLLLTPAAHARLIEHVAVLLTAREV